ncbi:MAG TPA: response regulator transcription factor [Puia sp.]|jgi:DNA-binding NarL/FixJ family response regulator
MANITIGLADDHQLFLKSLSLMVETFNGFSVIVEALNGLEVQEKLKNTHVAPDIMLIDVNMPQLDGLATTRWLHQRFPMMHLVALSMNDSDRTIISMVKAGCCAYLLKDTHPAELERALLEIHTRGFYNADVSNINYRRLLKTQQDDDRLQLSDREAVFLKLACSELTYKQVAAEMNVSERTVDGYRESLFQKLKVQSRVGLCLEAIRRGLVQIM